MRRPRTLWLTLTRVSLVSASPVLAAAVTLSVARPLNGLDACLWPAVAIQPRGGTV
jgi:hypothetical protein